MSTEQSVRPKPSEPAGAPSNEELIKGLNQDLGREYKTIIQYVVFSATLTGAQYTDIAEQLRQHASQELQHALLVAREIDYLGGEPSTEPFEPQTSDNPKEMLQFDLRAEEETIGNFSGRIKQAERAGKFAVSQVLRDTIVHEQDHAMNLKDALGIK